MRPREPSEMRKETPASDWTRQELTSSWLTMYLGSYFDRRYHCERADKLSLRSPWRRCVPPLSCPDSPQAFSTPSSLSTLLGAKACGYSLVGHRVCVGRGSRALAIIVPFQDHQSLYMTKGQPLTCQYPTSFKCFLSPLT